MSAPVVAAAASSEPVTTTTLDASGNYVTTWAFEGSTAEVVGPIPMMIEQAIVPAADGESVAVSATVEPIDNVAPDARAAHTSGGAHRKVSRAASGDFGCGGTAPLVAWPFKGTVKDWGTYAGSVYLCRDSTSSTKAYVIDKQIMTARGYDGLFTDTVPDTFWVQAHAHDHIQAGVLDWKPNTNKSDSNGCTSYDITLAGAVAEASTTAQVCDGTTSPISPHSITYKGVPSVSHGSKFEGNNLFMEGDTPYTIKNLGYRQAKRYSASNPYRNFVAHTGYRFEIDFDKVPE